MEDIERKQDLSLLLESCAKRFCLECGKSRSKGIGEAAQGVSAATAAAGHSTRGWNGKTATLKTIPVTELKPAAYNPRKKLKPGDKEYEKIKNSIQEFGFADPYREKIYRTRRWKNARCVCGA